MSLSVWSATLTINPSPLDRPPTRCLFQKSSSTKFISSSTGPADVPFRPEFVSPTTMKFTRAGWGLPA